MVSSPRGPEPTRRVRRLNEPRLITVRESQTGEPLAVLSGQVWLPVNMTRGSWSIDQYWWRGKEICRVYFEIAPADGPVMTIYRDLNTSQWFRQEY